MENDIKQHTLVFDKGLTNSPSDLLCDDDSLEICDGMTQVDGEWKAIQEPKLILDSRELYELACVHRGDGFKHYITIHRGTSSTSTSETTSTHTMGQRRASSVTSEGGTTIIRKGIGLFYEAKEEQTASGYKMTIKVFASHAVDVDINVTFKTKVLDPFSITIPQGVAMSDDYVITDDTWVHGDVIYYVSTQKGNSAYEYEWFDTTEPDEYNVNFQVFKTEDSNKITISADSGLNDDIVLKFLINDVYVVEQMLGAGETSVDFVPTDYVIRTVKLMGYSPISSVDTSSVYYVTRLSDVTDGTSGEDDEDPENPGSSIEPLDVLFYYAEGNDEEIEITQYSARYKVRDIATLGNMLIVTADEGMFYYLWTTNDDNYQYYKYLGDSIPEPVIEFRLNKGTTVWGSSIDEFEDGTDKETYNNAFVGLYSSAVKECHRKKYFCKPFLARAAVELKDGTFTKATAPVLLFGGVTKNGVVVHDTSDKVYRCGVEGNELEYKCSTSYEEWSDLVNGIVLFVSDEIDLFDTLADVDTRTSSDAYSDMICYDTKATTPVLFSKYTKKTYTDSSGTFKYFVGLSRRDTADVIDDICSARVFYKICDAGLEPMTVFSSTTGKMQRYTLENLTTQDALTSGDYYSHCKLIPDGIKMLNRRCNIWGITRGFFDGFSQFLPYSPSYSAEYHTYIYKVFIKTSSGIKTVKKTVTTKDVFYDGAWFYYPDTRAYKLQVFNVGGSVQMIAEAEMKEHSGLNGAYSFSQLPVDDDLNPREESQTTKTGTISTSAPAEYLSNYLLQSEVDSPLEFNASGYIRVGQGNIIGIAGLTTALSQDAYKVATTICFTDQGIWALKIDSTGQYTEIPPSFSREVCTNMDSITMTDNAVFFVSKKGLMCVTGTNEASVVCVSEQLKHNKKFHNTLNYSGMKIVYDYRESLVLILCDDLVNYSNWVYNIKSSVWSTQNSFPDTYCIVSDYPDAIIQNQDGLLFSYYDKDLPEDSDTEYMCSMTSRPMKFEGAMILKSVRQIKHLKVLKNGTFAFKMYGSNDLSNWNQLTSVKGKAWRYFKFKYTFTNIKASDSFIGTVVVTQSRHVDKLR